MKRHIILFLLFASLAAGAQPYRIFGNVIDTEAAPLPYATVVLLDPVDSTMDYFGITNTQGKFEIQKVAAASYILQVAFMGCETFSRKMTIPTGEQGDLGTIVLKPSEIALDAVQVSKERIPLLIKQDTVEYNADAFKTKPDGVAEDLLRKLPGLEVDRAGNIKAMGEDVSRVLVDGKEFFSTDPKVATKNLPAESVKKVQVYDKKTDEAELLGIDDSEYDKTINFVLKDNMKKALFGNVMAGGDAKNHYQGNAKVYRFTDKHQFAMLGMLNNINKPGFSFQDYIDFNGGLQSMMGGGGSSITIDADNMIPVDFGQTITGQLTSGAGGINYSYEIAKNNRVNISYMGNGSRKNQTSSIMTRNFTEKNVFEQYTRQQGGGRDANHLFNIGWRNKASKKQYFMVNGIVTLMDNTFATEAITESYTDNEFMNNLSNNIHGNADQLNTSLYGSWLRKGNKNWKMLKTRGSVKYSQHLKKDNWSNISTFATDPVPVEDAQYADNDKSQWQYSGSIGGLRKIAPGWYLEPTLEGGNVVETLKRQQGQQLDSPSLIDSLSPKLKRDYQWVKPQLIVKKYSKKSKINFGFAYEYGDFAKILNDGPGMHQGIATWLPQFSWDYEYKTSQRFSVHYSTSNLFPSALQLLPVISTSNPLALYFGNRKLKPEYKHNLNLSWYLFDQFSFTSLFTSLNAGYTKDKINQSINIADDLSQKISLINVPEDYTASASLNFSTPIRFLGIKMNLDMKELWNKGISYVNTVENININNTHKVGLSVENRKKEKWDVQAGGTFRFTRARYSIQHELNRDFHNFTAYGELRFTPNQHWHFSTSADITRYDAQSFSDAITVPLIGARLDYHFLANNRGMLSLEGYDLLNKNSGISRVSEYNYIREVNSNMIGRYLLLSFTFKLNKFGGEQHSGIRIEKAR